MVHAKLDFPKGVLGILASDRFQPSKRMQNCFVLIAGKGEEL